MKVLKNNFIMIGYVIRYCPMYMISALLYIASSNVLSLAEVFVIRDVIDKVTSSQPFAEVTTVLWQYLLVMGICFLAQRFHQTYLQQRFRHLWVKKIQHVMFEKSAKLDITCFDDPKTYDQFSKSLKEGDIKVIDSFDSFIYFLRSLTIVLSVGTYIIFQDVLLLALVLVQSVISFVLSSRITHMWYKAEKEQEHNDRRYNYIRRVFYLEKYTCDIKTTNLSNLLIANHLETNDAINEGYRKTENTTFILRLIEDIFYQISRNFAGYVYLMGRAYGKFGSKITIAVFSSTINAVLQFTGYLYGVVQGFVSIRENALYIDDFLWLMRYKPSIEGKGGKDIASIHPTISVSHVSFQYPSQTDYALKDVSLELKPKEKIAIIGYNGAGKTTLIKLLLKFYNTEEGTITFDNEDYRAIDERKLRSMYTSVFQDFQIYSVSVLENVLFRKRQSEEDDKIVWEALEKAGLSEKIRETKHGLDTILTKEFHDDGLMLSGGERQKLAIARIFASPSPIIILDEPTSSLDPVSEYEINRKILALCQEKSIILISHRLSTVIDASKIYMFDKGAIVECGSHKELMRLKGKYYEMFQTQAKLYQEA